MVPTEGDRTESGPPTIAATAGLAIEQPGLSTGLPAPAPGEPTGSKGKEPAGQAFMVGEGLPPVPAKLVGKILRGEFVDMAELLRDNIEADRRRNAIDPSHSCGAGGLGGTRPARREIPDILSWIQCFGVYICVVASKHPEKVPQLLAYQTMLIREARRCGGSGWTGYDTMFRLQAASDKGVDWSKLNSSLYATTFLAQQNGRGKTCHYCLETDHASSDCAMAPIARSVERSPRVVGLGVVPGAPRSEPRGHGRYEAGSDSRGQTRVYGRGPAPRQERRGMICYSWNEGTCRFHPYCRYRHACAKCQGDHRAQECPAYPPKGNSAPKSSA